MNLCLEPDRGSNPHAQTGLENVRPSASGIYSPSHDSQGLNGGCQGQCPARKKVEKDGKTLFPILYNIRQNGQKGPNGPRLKIFFAQFSVNVLYTFFGIAIPHFCSYDPPGISFFNTVV